jgi:hypothetical protein
MVLRNATKQKMLNLSGYIFPLDLMKDFLSTCTGSIDYHLRNYFVNLYTS